MRLAVVPDRSEDGPRGKPALRRVPSPSARASVSRGRDRRVPYFASNSASTCRPPPTSCCECSWSAVEAWPPATRVWGCRHTPETSTLSRLPRTSPRRHEAMPRLAAAGFTQAVIIRRHRRFGNPPTAASSAGTIGVRAGPPSSGGTCLSWREQTPSSRRRCGRTRQSSRRNADG